MNSPGKTVRPDLELLAASQPFLLVQKVVHELVMQVNSLSECITVYMYSV